MFVSLIKYLLQVELEREKVTAEGGITAWITKTKELEATIASERERADKEDRIHQVYYSFCFTLTFSLQCPLSHGPLNHRHSWLRIID